MKEGGSTTTKGLRVTSAEAIKPDGAGYPPKCPSSAPRYADFCESRNNALKTSITAEASGNRETINSEIIDSEAVKPSTTAPEDIYKGTIRPGMLFLRATPS